MIYYFKFNGNIERIAPLVLPIVYTAAMAWNDMAWHGIICMTSLGCRSSWTSLQRLCPAH